MGLSLPGYVVLQVRAWRRWRDRWRIPGRMPLLVTVPIAVYTVFALVAGSNLWPLLLILTTPFACVYLAGLALARRLFPSAA